MLCDLIPGKKVLISIRSHGIGLTSAMLDGKLRTWNSYRKHLSSLKLKISLFWIAQCAGCHQHGRSYLPCDGIVQRAYSLLESWMANFFFEMRLHWFMVVVFITFRLDICFDEYNSHDSPQARLIQEAGYSTLDFTRKNDGTAGHGFVIRSRDIGY